MEKKTKMDETYFSFHPTVAASIPHQPNSEQQQLQTTQKPPLAPKPSITKPSQTFLVSHNSMDRSNDTSWKQTSRRNSRQDSFNFNYRIGDNSKLILASGSSPYSDSEQGLSVKSSEASISTLLQHGNRTASPFSSTLKRESFVTLGSPSLGATINSRFSRFETLPSLMHETEISAVRSTDSRTPLTHKRLKSFVHDCSIPLPGLSRGSRIGVLLPEGPELAVCLVALLSHCCVVPMNSHFTAREVAAELTQLRADAVVLNARDHDEELVRILTTAGITIMFLFPDPNYCGLFTLNSFSTLEGGVHDLISITSSPRNRSTASKKRQSSLISFMMGDTASTTTTHSIHEHTDPEDTVMILRTSGTSGNKKTVPYTLRTLIVGAKCVAESWGLSPQDVNLNMMPLYHVGGIVRNLLAPILSGGTVIVTPGFDAVAFWEILQNHSPTWYYAVPTMHMAILEEGAEVMKKGHRLGEGLRTSIRMIANAGGGLPHSLAVQLRTVFQGSTVLPSYGMTECMPIATPPLHYKLEKPGTSGVSVGPEIAIMDGNNSILSAGLFGRIMVRGKPVFGGYENDDEANAKAFTADGFFDTGDMGYLDEDGYLFITGRSKEVINRGGEIISPVEIEDAVLSHPRVLNAIAFSVPHTVLQETVGIVIVSRDPASRVGLLELQRHVASTLHPTKWPQFVVYMEDLPKNQTNKPLRIKLAERLGLDEQSDNTPINQRHMEAECPPKGTPISVRIECQPVSSVNVEKLGKILCLMPFAREARIFSFEKGEMAAFVSGTQALSTQDVHDFLMGRVHDYEIPQDIIVVNRLPKDSHGTISFDKCKKIYMEQREEALTETERVLVDLFAKVLGLGRRPKKSDDFFEIGGSSLTAGKVTALIRSKFGVRLAPMVIFQHRTAEKLSEALAEAVQTDREKPGSNGKTFAFDGKIKSQSPVSVKAIYSQLLPLLVFRPLRSIALWLSFAHILSFIHLTFFFEYNNRGTVKTSVIIICQLMIAGAATGLLFQILSPIICLIAKWTLIGRYKAGEYPLWGSAYLRWWIVDHILLQFDSGVFGWSNITRIAFWKMMGAKIAWNFKFDKNLTIREFDLIKIEENCVAVDTLMRPFTMEPGLMVLKPIVIERNSILNMKSSIAPGSVIRANTVLPPMSSSYDASAESSDKYRIFAGTGPDPNIIVLLLVGFPFIAIFRVLVLIPWACMVYWMVQFPFFGSPDDVAYLLLSNFGQLVLHFKDPRRIGIHVLGLLAHHLIAPFLRVALLILVKRCLIGKFTPGEKRRSQVQLLRHWIMSTLVDRGELGGVYELLGRHYEGISIIYRALGAKIGKRVYWPGTPMSFYEFDLIDIGDDVVFGSRSKFVFSDAIETRPIQVHAGAMVADRCVILPGAVIGKNAMIGSGSLLCKNGFYPPGSTWIGSKGGDAILWDAGNPEVAENEPTLRPFGKAFYLKKANFKVFSQGFIFAYSAAFETFSTLLWSLPLLVGITLSGSFYDMALSKTVEAEVQGHLYFAMGYLFTYYWAVVISLAVPVTAKRFVTRRLTPGSYDWDMSDYCQRWQVAITMQKIASEFVNDIRGSAFIVSYFRALGCSIGERVCLYPTGGDPMMTEPDLVSIGDHTVIDKASIVAHINSKGKFALNELQIGNFCVLRSDARLLSGAEMCDNSRLMERTLVLGGDTVEAGKAMQGWPANDHIYD
ncbi:hypothetical protein HDU78_000332 [Chytriomyces hyalinus]|nr:hypothetical protein HDU78_000332 [Chytriomyces hyalinus]